MRRRHRLLIGYGILLGASHLWRALHSEPPPLAVGEQALDLAAIPAQHQTRPAATVRLSYREWGTSKPGQPAILLLHGSPGSAGDFDHLGPMLAASHRVIATSLPGFGSSSRQLPDYSISAHARYLQQLANRLRLDSFHLVGFSMGGGVALHLAELEPERSRSLTLLSSIGVQELELLGNYHANHALHGLQLGGLWLLFEAVPHFGLLDGGMLSLPYGRNFYDTDQRPLRGILQTYAGPMLILHGQDDVLVPYAAAVEHQRLVPQAELVTFAANHFLVFRAAERLAAPLSDFLRRVESGQATVRQTASVKRRRGAAEPFTARLPAAHGMTLLVWGVLLAAATLLSEDLTCITAGLLVAQGRLSLLAAALACFVGIFIGDLLLYGAGRWLGRPWLGQAPLKWLISPAGLERGENWFEQRGAWMIFASRFLPGTRIPTYVGAGALRAPFWWFAACLFLPVALWTPLLVGLASVLGSQLLDSFEVFSRWALPGLLGLAAIVWGLLLLSRSLLTWRGRRLLAGWWRRKIRWEYWPPWMFYPPVMLYVLGLGMRYRSLTLFTAANPGIARGSGFIGESKSEILACLDAEKVARYALLPAGEEVADRRARVERFLQQNGLDLPVVLKPDIGERGRGVAVVRSIDELERWLGEHPTAAIVQRYVAGLELGIFWLALPGEERGRIFSITDKQLPEVVGDGGADLEHLVLRDRRLVAMAAAYLQALGASAARVPAAGERVRLVDVGTHCRGAIFLDGAHLATPTLEAAIERLSRGFEGFYFGRYDLRAASPAALGRGEFQILELNGVTSEATHIYDPTNSLWTAYRVLFEQWRLAFEIGHRNHQRGFAPLSLSAMLRLLINSRSRSSS